MKSMKTFLKIITLTAAVVAISNAQAADAQKIGVVLPAKVMQESPMRDNIVKKLEGEFKGRFEEISALEKEIKDLEVKIKRDGELLSNSELTALQRKIEVKVSEYKLKRKAFEEDQRQRQSEEQQKVLKVMSEAINEIAEKGNYDLILNGEQVVYAKPAVDISDQVIQEISKK